MVVNEKIYLEAYINKEYISLKNNTAQLYLISRTANLHWNFSSISKDGPDIHRFFNMKCVLTTYTLGNLGISGAFLSNVEKFKMQI